jgi:drug/metabolite transporter (DMT)-like permease
MLSAIFGVFGQVCLNAALIYEEATTVALFKTTDVLLTFLLQFFFLNIRVDLFNIKGSLAIVLGTLIILLYINKARKI